MPSPPPVNAQPEAPSDSATTDLSASLAGEGGFNAEAIARRSITHSLPRIETDYTYLLCLAISLEKMARDEIARLSVANDPDTIEHNKKQIDLLSILADGFAKIAAALQEYGKDPQPLLAGKAKEVVNWAGTQLQVWWEANAVEGRELLVRLPVIGASLAAFGLAGADMHFATPLVGALVGGPKWIAAFKAAMPTGGLGKTIVRRQRR
jgi:hypothetical protein